jgi:methylated-DNA-[protein]-cysteine S-methyltransferase
MKKLQKSFTEKVYDVVAKIPKGSVMTYKEVARRAGSPNAYRAVGNIMNKNPDTKRVPCHRVVRSDGDPGGYARGRAAKIKILRSEGVII